MALIKKFGAVEINVLAAPSSKDKFEEIYKGKVPNLEEAWKEISKHVTVESNPVKKKRKRKTNG